MLKKLAMLLGFLMTAALPAPAGQVGEREMLCPVCRRAFYARLDLTGEHLALRLDLKPVGEVSGPWLLPDCPSCGFVIYSAPLLPAELAKCKKIVASGDFRKYRDRSTYYRVGLLYERLGMDGFTLANTFLKASWQEEGEPARLKEDLELSLKYFAACAQGCGYEEKENSQLLTGELLRRLGRFGEASSHLSGLRGLKGFQNNFFSDIVDYQLKLCAEKDASPRGLEDVKEFKKPFFSRMFGKLKRFLNAVGALVRVRK